MKRRFSPHSLLQTILIIAIVVLGNLLLSGVSVRLDLTEDKQFTLSDVSKQIVESVQDPVTIKLFLSEELPQDMLALKQDVSDLLQEYQRTGNGQMLIEQIDPKKDSKGLQDATNYGIPEIQFNVVGNEKFEVSTGYAGIALLYGEKREAIPVITQTNNLEYEMTAAIQKMTREELPSITFLSDHGTQPSQALQRYFAKQAEARDVTIDELGEVKHLIINGPREEFSEKDRYAIDQVLMRGGSVFVLLDGKIVDEQAGSITDNPSKLDELLTAYGVTVEKNLVADFASPQTLQFGSGAFTVLQPYPLWPKIIPDYINQESPITSKIQTATLPWPSSLSITAPSGVQVSELVKTSPRSKAFTDLTSIQPDTLPTPTTEEMSQQLLAAVLVGGFDSAFKGKELPAEVQKDTFVDHTDAGTLFVVGNSRFVADAFLGQSIENALLLVNGVDVFTQDSSLVTIRSRSALSRPIKPLSDTQKVTTKYMNIFSSVVLVIIAAIVVGIIRRQKTRNALKQYA